MVLETKTEKIPLMADRDGVMRVGGTRVTLDTVVHAFKQGATAEEIVQRYSSLDLADVYGVISYYLRHQAQVENYMREREEESRQVRKQNESRFDPIGIRDRLMARRSKKS